ncbi:papilin-like [Haemaphysalis longicornis]
MEMGLHVWLLVLLFCVTFTKGKEQTKADGATSDGDEKEQSQEDTDNSGENEAEKTKRKVVDKKIKGQEQTNKDGAKSKEKEQEKAKEGDVKPPKKGQKQPKEDADHTKEEVYRISAYYYNISFPADSISLALKSMKLLVHQHYTLYAVPDHPSGIRLAKEELRSELERRYWGALVRSREQRVEYKAQPSKIFRAFERERIARKKINEVSHGGGVAQGQKEVAAAFCDYFKDLFRSRPTPDVKAQHHPCLQKLKIGPCKATIPRFWFDGRKCDVFLWGGCKPNGNNFHSKSECEEKCLGRALPLECYESKKQGPCKAAITRWYFNGIRCKKFLWGGCKPNGNNFETKLQCKKTCTAPKVNCLDPLKTGPCQAAIPRFRFDGRSCTKFLWGGCNPNGNNFPSKLACKLTCHGKPPPPTCVGPRKIGPCKGAIPRWWFDGHVCKKFLWGGCAPNGNNYVTKKECEKTCLAPPPNCHDPQKKGPCKGSILRYWYSGKRCKSFFWGGCNPNGNNFHSRHECEKRCLGNSNSKNKTKSAAPKQELQESNLDEAEKLSI